MRRRIFAVLVALVLLVGSAASADAAHFITIKKGLRTSTGGSFSVTQRFGGCVGAASATYDLTVTVSYGAINSTRITVKSVKLAVKIVSFGNPSELDRGVFVDEVHADADGGDINGWSAEINHSIYEPITTFSVTKTVNRSGNWLGGYVRIVSNTYPTVAPIFICQDELTVAMYFVPGTPL